MNLYITKEVDFEHSDDRGNLYQLVHNGYEQINVLISKKNVTRGGHYHKISKEAFFVVEGAVEVTFKYKDQLDVALFDKNSFFEIQPNVVHSMFFPKDCILVAMYDICIEKTNGEKDIFMEMEENV